MVLNLVKQYKTFFRRLIRDLKKKSWIVEKVVVDKYIMLSRHGSCIYIPTFPINRVYVFFGDYENIDYVVSFPSKLSHYKMGSYVLKMNRQYTILKTMKFDDSTKTYL